MVKIPQGHSGLVGMPKRAGDEAIGGLLPGIMGNQPGHHRQQVFIHQMQVEIQESSIEPHRGLAGEQRALSPMHVRVQLQVCHVPVRKRS